MFDPVALLTLPVAFALLAGVLIGLVGGALPGISGITTLILLLPFVLPLDPAVGLTILLAAHGVVYTGGAVTAIMLAIPGTPPNAAALEDGHGLAQSGLAARAIAVAACASGIGGLIGFVLLIVAIPLSLPILRAIGAPEIFAAALVGLLCVARVGADTFLKGMIPAAFGVFLGSIGYQQTSGIPRFWFEQTPLLDGIGLIPLIIGLFAGPEIVRLAGLATENALPPSRPYLAQILAGIGDVLRRPALLLRSSGVGGAVGLVPGVGGEAAAFLSYSWFGRPRTRISDLDDRLTGVIAAESSNNAKEGGALLPTLTLGIPGSAGMAVLIGALVLFGFEPGPTLVADNSHVVILLAFVLAAANLLGCALIILLIPLLLRIVRIPVHFLVPVVTTLAVIGVVAYRGSPFDLILAAGAFAIGAAMVRFGYSRASLVLGFILAPFVETYASIALAAYGAAFLVRPGVIALLVLAAAISLPWDAILGRRTQDR